MASSLMTSTAIAPSAMRGASLSSRVSSFQVAAPVKNSSRRNVAVRASANEDAQPRRAFLATLAALSMGAGVALADDNQGRGQVRSKANDLLKAADDLTNNDSPPRYGPDRGEDSSQSDRGAARGGGDAKLQAKAGLNKSNFNLEQRPRDIYGRARQQIEKALGKADS